MPVRRSRRLRPRASEDDIRHMNELIEKLEKERLEIEQALTFIVFATPVLEAARDGPETQPEP